jgi:lysophospholipase L1-like esterase
MQQAGVISGRDTGLFDPQTVATRVEVACIMQRFNSAIKPQETTPDDSSDDNDETQEEEDEPYNGYIPFGNVVQQSASADMSYFSDALFIGHSIVVGLSQSYTNTIPNAGFFAINGGTTIGILGATELDYTGVTRSESGAVTVENYTGSLQDALEGYNYSKVYIMLGINEMTNSAGFISRLSQIITQVRAQLGSPKIYLISVTPLSKTYTSYSTSFKRNNILAYNNALMQLSLDANVYYLDMFSAFATADGYITDEYTRDGVHLTNAGYSVFLDYLRTHT